MSYEEAGVHSILHLQRIVCRIMRKFIHKLIITFYKSYSKTFTSRCKNLQNQLAACAQCKSKTGSKILCTLKKNRTKKPVQPADRGMENKKKRKIKKNAAPCSSCTARHMLLFCAVLDCAV